MIKPTVETVGYCRSLLHSFSHREPAGQCFAPWRLCVITRSRGSRFASMCQARNHGVDDEQQKEDAEAEEEAAERAREAMGWIAVFFKQRRMTLPLAGFWSPRQCRARARLAGLVGLSAVAPGPLPFLPLTSLPGNDKTLGT